MVLSKRIGFFWGEEKITLVEFEKNVSHHVISLPLDSKTNTASPFSSGFTEEIQITAAFQKALKDSRVSGGSFYVSVPVKDIILRSFVIPFVKQEDIQNTIKFEARKYLPIDIQDLAFVFHTALFTENAVRRLKVTFFAVRKETLERYERIFKQANAVVTYCEPCVVSLTKVLLFKKEISPADHLAFLILDKNSGRICFIDRGIPQYIREFSISSDLSSEKTDASIEAMDLKIVDEVVNSFDFYARQFSTDSIGQILISTETQRLFNALETELRLKSKKVSLLTMTEGLNQNNDIDAIYAMGACVEPAMEALSTFNFLEKNTSKAQLKNNLVELLGLYKEIIFVFLICVISLVGVHIFLQAQLKITQQGYDQLSSKQGSFLNVSVSDLQKELQDDTDMLASYKNIRTKSDVAFIVLKVASHLPQGTLLKELTVDYDQGDSNDGHVAISMKGDVFGEDPNEEIAVVNQIFSDFKNDKELSEFIKTVNLVSLNREDIEGKQATGFVINCS